MTYILLFLIVISFYYLTTSYINKYCWYFIGIIWSLVAALYSVFILISITGNYSSIGYVFNDLDRQIFLSMVKNKSSLFFIMRMFNLSTALYLLTLCFFSVSYFKIRKRFFGGLNATLNILLVLFPVFYVCFYDPETTYMMYRYVTASTSQAAYNIVCGIDLAMHTATYFFLFMPLVYLVVQQRKKLLSFYKKRQLWGVVIFVFLSNILYLCILNLSSLREPYIGNNPYFMIAIRTYGATFKREYLIYPLIMLLAIVVMIITSHRFYLIHSGGMFGKFHIKKRFNFLNKNMIGVFHSIKNIIFSYVIALDDAMLADPEEQKELLTKLSTRMHEYVDHLSLIFKTNDSFGDFYTEEYYVSDILDETIDDFEHPDNIRIVKNYLDKAERIYADSSYIKDAFGNILKNALEAINVKDCDGGTIKISVFREFDLAVIVFEDDGYGMSREMRKNIFKPFYTTKTRIENWGIGLSYVNKIIKMHNGNISVKSALNQGTSFTIILPIVETNQ